MSTDQLVEQTTVRQLPLLLTVPQVAKELNLGRTTIYQLIYAKRLETVKVGKAIRVTGVGLSRFIEELRENGGLSETPKGSAGNGARKC